MTQEKEPERRERPETKLPIDIDYAKFLPWLIDRRRIPKNWHVQLKSARALARTAYTETPSNLRGELGLPEDLPVHESLSYGTARTVLSKLTETDTPAGWGVEKDLLGRYKNVCQRAWATAVSAFEKGLVHLADDAQQLVRNADVHAPALRTEIARLNAEAADLARKEGPAIRTAAEARERYDALLASYELEGGTLGDFHALLLAFVQARVPSVLQEAAVAGRQLSDVLEYYGGFARLVAGGECAQVCGMLRRVVDADLETVVRVDVGASRGAVDAGGGGIDWGDGGIDWGIEVGESGADESAEGGGVAEEGGGGIDWDIEVEPAEGEKENSENGGADSEAVGGADGVTLADGNVREEYLNDLHELEAFLSRRAHELGRAGGSEMGVAQSLTSGMPADLREVTEERVCEMQERVQKAIHALSSQETKYLLSLHSNGRVFDRAAREIREKKLAAERLDAAIDTLREARRKVSERLAEESPKLKDLAGVTRQLLEETETTLSKLYQGRTVNILGEINNIFPPGS